MEERRKRYVDVNVYHFQDGTCRPVKIRFANGEIYQIDRLRQVVRAASTKAGGTGIRYTVQIRGTETYLFDDEHGKWFVEEKVRDVYGTEKRKLS